MPEDREQSVRAAFSEGVRIGAVDTRFAHHTRDVMHALESTVVEQIQPGERLAIATPATIFVDDKRHLVGCVVVAEHRILCCYRQRLVGGAVRALSFRPSDATGLRRVERSVGPMRRGQAIAFRASGHQIEILLDPTTTDGRLLGWVELAVGGAATFTWAGNDRGT